MVVGRRTGCKTAFAFSERAGIQGSSNNREGP